MRFDLCFPIQITLFLEKLLFHFKAYRYDFVFVQDIHRDVCVLHTQKVYLCVLFTYTESVSLCFTYTESVLSKFGATKCAPAGAFFSSKIACSIFHK